MDSQSLSYTFFGIFVGQWVVILILDKKYSLLRDNSNQLPKPFSWSRVQLAWWTVIVISVFVTLIFKTGGIIPTFNNSTLYLLGISSATTVSATLTDINDQSNPGLTNLAQNMKGTSLLYDILSDKNGMNIHRFQTFLFNLIFGVWFIFISYQQLLLNPTCTSGTNAEEMKNWIACMTNYANQVMPVISTNNLILIGASSGLYAALKTTENKQPFNSPTPATKKTATNLAPNQVTNQPLTNTLG